MGGDVRGAAAVAVGSLGSLDVKVQEFHLSEQKTEEILNACYDNKNIANMQCNKGCIHSWRLLRFR